MSKEKFILASIVSAFSGAIIGLLFAPEKGSKTRKTIARESDKYLQDLKNSMDELRKDLNKRADSTRADIDRMGKDAKSRGDDILKKAKKVASYDEWTKEELYERAKEKEIENYSKMNKSELISALRNN